MYRYFAYGSALSRRHIGEWAAEHGVDARLFARGAPAVLRGYRLVFDVESRFWGGRVANLAEDEEAAVHGVLFEIPPPAKDAVLRKEGVATGLSEEIDVSVEAEGKRIAGEDRKSTRLNSSHDQISYAVFCLKKKKNYNTKLNTTSTHRINKTRADR